MTKQQKAIRADILGMLMDRVEDIFIDMQQAFQVESGDVSPFDALHLQETEEQLADRIMEILIRQKGDE